jgi:hypothetical protein
MTLEQSPLFPLPVLSWDVLDSWEWTDPYGKPIVEERVVREWHRECPHASDECTGCGTPIGWALVAESLAHHAHDGTSE